MTAQSVDLAFALADIAEAEHALYMLRMILDRAKHNEPHNINKALRYAEQAERRITVACKIVRDLSGGAA